jgi:HK97 family phage portal protein
MGIVSRVADVFGPGGLQRRSIESPFGGGSVIGTDGWGTISLEQDEGKWTASAAGYRCVQAIAGNAASLGLEVRDQQDTIVEGHWLSLLWERPNDLWSRRILAEVMWSRLETKGETFVYVDRGQSGTGTPSALWPIWGQVKVIIAGVEDESTGQIRRVIVGYQVTVPGGKKVGLLPTEVLWLRYPHPSQEFGAMAPLEAAGHAVEMDAYARAWQIGEFRNGAKPKHVIYLGDMTEDQYKNAVAAYRSSVAGPQNAGKSLLLASKAPSRVARITNTAEEMSWLDTRNVSWQEVMLAFGVPKDYLLGGATYENRAASRTTLWSDTIIGKLEIVASEITRQLLVGEPGRRARFPTEAVDALQEGEDAKAKRTTDLTAHDVTTLDEAREAMGLDPLPGGVGGLTLTAYRTWIQMQAQAALLNGQEPAERSKVWQLIVQTPGRAAANAGSGPLLLPSGIRKHGPSKTDVLSEYDRHERLIAKAVGRMAKRQQAVVLTNADRVFGGKTKKSQAWLREFTGLVAAALAEPDDDRRVDLEVAIRAKISDLYDVKHWTVETAKDLEPSVGGAWHSGATQLAKSLGLDFDKLDTVVLAAMDDRLEEMAAQVSGTTKDVLESRVLIDGVAAGESVDQLKARIRGVFSDLSSWRATTIARTETVGGFNGGSYVIAEASGVVAQREWLATNDTRTRDTHERQDGATVKGFNTRYPNGCLYPGDPTAKAEEVILCRCVELYLTDD